MAISDEIAMTLFSLGRYKEKYPELRAEVSVTEQLIVPTEWKQAEEARRVEPPVPVWLRQAP